MTVVRRPKGDAKTPLWGKPEHRLVIGLYDGLVRWLVPSLARQAHVPTSTTGLRGHHHYEPGTAVLALTRHQARTGARHTDHGASTRRH